MGTADAILDKLNLGGVFAGRYEVDSMLGRGGMGVVYRVRDAALGEPIALKVLLPSERDDFGALLERFRQEVRLARRVTHPNVARVYDLGEIDGLLFLTMELVEGGTLRTLLHGGPVPFARAAAIGAALAAGLRAAHAVGVVHRDLKPSNVLLDPTGRVLITDFGIARSLDEDRGLTVGAIGTPSYMAPEQAAQAGVEPRTDLYALGLIVYEMLVGSLPPRDGKGVPGAALGRLAPAEVAAVVERCLAPSPDDRPRDALEVFETLQAASETAEVRAPSARPMPGRVSTARGLGSNPPPGRLTLPPPQRALAVLPLRYRGAPEHEEVRDALCDELVDQLSRTRGLKVFASSATARFRADRDPRAIGRELGAEYVIDGVIQREPDLLRITLRLLDASTAVQLWSDRIEASFADALAAAESLARRIAEALRVEIGLLGHATLPEGVVETYFAARRRLRLPHPAVAIEARDGFETCLERAPDFSQAIAGHAVASLRCAFLLDDPEHAVARAADISVDRALAEAPELAETHLAAAMLAGHHGEYACAVKELERALAIAPSYPDAHEYLAMLECEAGLAERGIARARLAIDLDPSLSNAAYVLARAYAYRGDWEASLHQIDQVERLLPPNAIGPIQTRLRLLAWKRDFPAVERLLVERLALCGSPEFIRLVGETIVGRRPLAETLAAHEAIIARRKNRRFISFTYQVTAEMQALRGDLDGALASVRTSVDAVLIDVEWMRSCPLLEPLRSKAAFAVEMDRVRVRGQALWS